jgi:ABC-type antimicrobial peptide transport system permease subunit
VVGASPEFPSVRSWEDMAEGDFFTQEDVDASAPVCVIGQTILRELFLGDSPIGKEMRVGNVNLKVVGVLSAKGANLMGSDQDDIVLAPWTTVRYRISGIPQAQQTVMDRVSNSVNSLNSIYPSSQPKFFPTLSSAQQANNKMFVRFTTVNQILVAAMTPDDKPYAIDQITAVLRERHGLSGDTPDDFRIYDRARMSEKLASTSQMMTKLLFGVALISLVVGGVGIMNIMLVSVTERTKEIGLRMAVGARSADILRQFLAEAIWLCLIGGLIGIILGHGGSLLLKYLMRWPVETSPRPSPWLWRSRRESG